MDNFDLIKEALAVADEAEKELTAEEETALAAFTEILAFLPPQVIRGVRRALIEGWLDGQATLHSAVYPSLMALIGREMSRCYSDTITRINRIAAPSLVPFASDIQPFEDVDTNDKVCALLDTLSNFVTENELDIWL
jgi:hypothetical protein